MFKPATFSLVSLGCPKNLVDSEHVVHSLKKNGLIFQTDIDGSETVIVNTCGFIKSARDEARKYINALIDLKRENRIKKISVRGCMVQHTGIDKLAEEFPEVDDWETLINEKHPVISANLLTASHIAYLRIADGCNRRCAFCTIPAIRGNYRSVPKNILVSEAKQLAANGVKELVLIAQETTFWGRDLTADKSPSPGLTDLIREIESIEGIRWIRLMYTYPQFFGDDLIALFAAGGKLLPYIDIPLQHCSNEILTAMNRLTSKAEIEALLGKLRERIPNLILRTSFIVGFPGETDAHFKELLQFVERWKFERAGVFKFSPEQGTPAAKLPRISPKIIDRRYDALYKVCEKHSTAWAKQHKGQTIDVQIDGNYTDENNQKMPNLYIGRTYADAPDIDPVVYVTVNEQENMLAGSLIQCEIVETDGCDLAGIA